MTGSGDGQADQLDASELDIGTEIDGRYRITGFVGRGGMGRVYRALHLGLKTEVAVKLLPSSPRDVDRLRFEREALAAGRASHPNCVNTSDFGRTADGVLYLVMELLEGEPLSDLLDREGTLPEARAIHITQHVLRALAHSHKLGVVHRDLKPQNIFLVEHLGDRDFAKVLDFGLAKLLGDAGGVDAHGTLTEAHVTFGTPAYMSPEQALGQNVDGRGDLYAVGVILFQMLTGRRPFENSEPLKLLMMHATNEPPSVRAVKPDAVVSERTEHVIRRALAKQPDDRFPDAAAMAEALAGAGGVDPTRPLTPTPMTTDPTLPLQPGPAPVLSGQQMRPTPPPSQELRAAAPAPNRRRIAVALGAAAVITATGITAWVMSGSDEPAPSSKPATKPVVEQSDASVAATEPPAAKPEDAGIDVSADLARINKLISGYRKARARKELDKLRARHRKNPRVLLALGHLYHRIWPTKSVRVYRSAVQMDPSLKSDAAMIDNLIHSLGSRSANQGAIGTLRIIGKPALPALREAAVKNRYGIIKRRAKALIKEIERR